MANRFLVAGGSGLWNDVNNWSATSGGGSGASFPVNVDVVAFDSLSGNAPMTVNVTSACASLTMSGTYAGTLTFSAQLSIFGSLTLTAACTIAGAGPILFASAGTITTNGKVLVPNLNFTGTVTYTMGTAVAWSGTLTMSNNQTFAGAALSGTGNVTITGATITLNNTGGLVTTGTLTLPNGACTFAGTAGFTVGTLTTPTLTASRTYTLTFGNTYTVTTALINAGTTASIVQSIVSSSPGNKVVFNLQAGASCDLIYCNPTDVTSSGGREIVTTRGTITTSTNWVTTPTPTGGTVVYMP